MKDYFKISILLFAFFLCSFSNSQNRKVEVDKEVKCKVKGVALKEGDYSGKCKKGLAHGKGKFVYKDGRVFEGVFKKGMITGKGELYTLHNGNKKVIKKGFWEKNKYLGEKKVVPYIVKKAFNIDRNIIKRKGEGNQVSINFLRNGNRNPVTNLNIMSTNGIDVSGSNVNRLNIIKFPVEIQVIYFTRNKFNTTTYQVDFEFIINEPGDWDVTIYN
ncbi:hypothetical protein DIS18_02855 [Algibacter marinivivus]|uniref:MORN repeat protein n=1 Tax=Algibacter marinivivus TaxID=2100723 RepID=A0A2U2X6Y7_9FLAO|nr:hypothetical protein [Algibacter marinivivus]PWH83510.1 hypothetical protein DIS18_02855 [Algibacter marinivivus]